jgi:hypothetical protein
LACDDHQRQADVYAAAAMPAQHCRLPSHEVRLGRLDQMYRVKFLQSIVQLDDIEDAGAATLEPKILETLLEFSMTLFIESNAKLIVVHVGQRPIRIDWSGARIFMRCDGHLVSKSRYRPRGDITLKMATSWTSE